MSNKRKTAKLTDVIDYVNKLNRESTCTIDIRIGWNELLRDMLLQANVYDGYCYLHEVPEGQLPGIAYEGSKTVHPDESRRCFYKHKSLVGET